MAIKRTDETPEDFAQRERAEMSNNLPHRGEDEKYTISCALTSQGAGEEIAAKMELDDYYLENNRRAFLAILTLIERGQTVTLHNVYQTLLDTAEGDAFSVLTPFELSAMYDKAHFGDARGLADAIARLKRVSKVRAIILAAREAERVAFETEDPERCVTIFNDAERQVSRANASVVGAERAAAEAGDTYDRLNRGEIVCVPSGLPEMDRLLYGGGFWGGDNIIVAGETSTGKTTFALNLMLNACALGFPCLYFSLEMKRFKIVSRIHSNLARVPNWKIRPNMDELSGQGLTARLRQTLDRVSNLPFRIDDSTNRVDDLARVCRYEVKQKGIKAVFTDYMGLLRPPRGFRGGAYERATEVSRILTETSHDLGVPFVNVCQLRRMLREEISHNKDRGKDTNEPDISMLKQSGDIENDADTVIMLWRNKEDVKEGERNQLVDAWGKLAKQRQGELGRFKLLFAPDIYKFSTPELLEEERRGAEREASNF